MFGTAVGIAGGGRKKGVNLWSATLSPRAESCATDAKLKRGTATASLRQQLTSHQYGREARPSLPKGFGRRPASSVNCNHDVGGLDNGGRRISSLDVRDRGGKRRTWAVVAPFVTSIILPVSLFLALIFIGNPPIPSGLKRMKIGFGLSALRTADFSPRSTAALSTWAPQERGLIIFCAF
jgi:hypothetical protein